jgi:membrane associated rhomboid family serine protease
LAPSFAQIWPNLAKSGQIWPNLAKSGQIWMDPHSAIPSLGASGAIAGMLGAYLRMFPSNRIRVMAPLGWLMFPIRLAAERGDRNTRYGLL